MGILFLPLYAAAHDRTSSFSSWEIHGAEAVVRLRFSEIDLTRYPWAHAPIRERTERLKSYLTGALQLSSNGDLCRVTKEPRALPGSEGRLAFEWHLSCPSSTGLAIRTAFLLDVAPAHLHFARVQRDGSPESERVLSSREPAWALDGTAPGEASSHSAGSTSLAGYIGLGIEHILSGYDHLAFVFALILIGGTLRELAQVVTGFTVAHSITLGLAALGLVKPAAAPVEAIIGLSIALVAAENIWLLGSQGWGLPAAIVATLLGLTAFSVLGHGQLTPLSLAGLALFVACYFGLLHRAHTHHSLRWSVAFLFGLVHGFGFASVLGEAGLPAGRAATALFGFNVGVELGQLFVVCLLWPFLRWITRGEPRRYEAVVRFGSAAVAGLGVFWFVERSFG